MTSIPKKWRYSLIGVIIIALAVGLVVVKKRELALVSKPLQRGVPVHVVAAIPGTVDVTLHYPGKTDSILTADISSRISAYILAVHYREGDSVKAGDIMVDLDDTTLVYKVRADDADLRAAESALTSAESNYEATKASFDRDEYLYKNKAESQQTYEGSRALVAAAYSQVVAAKERIKSLSYKRQASATEESYTHIFAPFNGVVTKRLAEPGNLAVPGKPLLTIKGTGEEFKVTVQVPQEQATVIKAGTEVILSDGTNKEVSTVYKVYPALDTNNLAIVEIRIAKMPFNLPVGSNIGVDIVMNQAKGLVVPAHALATNRESSFVVTVDDNNVVKQVPVRILGRNDKKVAISGIDSNTNVVIGEENLLIQLMDGKTVTVFQGGGEGN